MDIRMEVMEVMEVTPITMADMEKGNFLNQT